MSKVTIILTSHNRPQMLKEAIYSILNQTLRDLELIIIDDYSTVNGVLDVLKEARQDKRVRVFRTNYDVDNISVLWNLALDRATGEYISLLDDDNKKELSFCQKMSDYLDTHPSVDAVACFMKILNEGRPAGTFDKPKEMNKYNIIYNNFIDSGCMMIRRTIIDKIGWFDERLRTAEDWDYVKRIVLQTNGFGILQEPLTYYNWHKENRMYRSESLGFQTHKDFIINRKNYNKILNLLFFHQDSQNLTLSQNNVLNGVLDALKDIEFVKVEDMSVSQLSNSNKYYDIIFCFAPFSIDISHIKTIQMYGNEQIHFHCEDPQALGTNLERAKLATYIYTNDISVQKEYEKIVGRGNVGYCCSISLNDIRLKFRKKVDKKYDIVFYGYPYDSRVKFIKELLPEIKKTKYNLLLVGADWEKKGLDLPHDYLNEQKSINLLEQARVVILHNRRNTDLGGDISSIKPRSVVRGYFECGSGSLVMLDDERSHHGFNKEVIFYNGVKDLIEKIDYYMENKEEREDIASRAKQRALKDFTYKTRITKLLNAVRSRRYYFEVK